MIIVLAKRYTVSVCVGTDGVDLGRLPRMEERQEAQAAVWVREGTDADIEKALDWAHAQQDGWEVFTYAENHPDPLGQAKGELLGD